MVVTKFISALGDHSFSTYAKFFLPPDTHTNVCLSGAKKYSFSENFAYVLNE